MLTPVTPKVPPTVVFPVIVAVLDADKAPVTVKVPDIATPSLLSVVTIDKISFLPVELIVKGFAALSVNVNTVAVADDTAAGNVIVPVNVGLAFGANVLVSIEPAVSSTYFFVAACKSEAGAADNVTVPPKAAAPVPTVNVFVSTILTLLLNTVLPVTARFPDKVVLPPIVNVPLNDVFPLVPAIDPIVFKSVPLSLNTISPVNIGVALSAFKPSELTIAVPNPPSPFARKVCISPKLSKAVDIVVPVAGSKNVSTFVFKAENCPQFTAPESVVCQACGE